MNGQCKGYLKGFTIGDSQIFPSRSLTEVCNLTELYIKVSNLSYNSPELDVPKTTQSVFPILSVVLYQVTLENFFVKHRHHTR